MISSRGAEATNRTSLEIPLLIISYDIFHALNLVMKKCIATFPKKYINIITEISSTFSYSGVKTAELQEIMEKKGTKPLKILRYVPTRWTSFFECLERILLVKEHLISYFKTDIISSVETQSTTAPRFIANMEDKTTKSADKIHKSEYFLPRNTLMLELLKYLLLKLQDAVKFFEKDNLEICAVISRVKSTIVLIGEYLFNLHSDANSANIEPYEKLIPIITSGQNSKLYTASLKTLVQFKEYFLSVNPYFKKQLDIVEPTSIDPYRDDFFLSAFEFMKVAFETLTKKLPRPESTFMKAEAIGYIPGQGNIWSIGNIWAR